MQKKDAKIYEIQIDNKTIIVCIKTNKRNVKFIFNDKFQEGVKNGSKK